jgi:hypothetical protein
VPTVKYAGVGIDEATVEYERASCEQMLNAIRSAGPFKGKIKKHEIAGLVLPKEQFGKVQPAIVRMVANLADHLTPSQMPQPSKNSGLTSGRQGTRLPLNHIFNFLTLVDFESRASACRFTVAARGSSGRGNSWRSDPAG